RYQSVTFRGHRPARLRLLGGESCDPQLSSVLASTLPIPVEPGQPLSSVDRSAMPKALGQSGMGQWAMALGLALRRTTKHFRPLDGRPRGSIVVNPDFEGALVSSAATNIENRTSPVAGATPTELAHA